MTDWTSIANMALLQLGARPITSLDENSNNARNIKSVYEAIRDEVLYSHPWKPAKTRAWLAADAVAPIFGPAYAYTLPADPFCLRPWQVGDEDNWFREDDWHVEGRQILTDSAPPLRLIFVCRLLDPGQFAGLLATAMARRIAAEIAYRTTNSREKEAAAAQAYEEVLAKARSADAQQGSPPRHVVADTILEARS